MAESQKIEYRIGKDGKIIETVINASGSSCTSTTSGGEQLLFGEMVRSTTQTSHIDLTFPTNIKLPRLQSH